MTHDNFHGEMSMMQENDRSFFAKLADLPRRMLIERQLIIRSNGEIKYITFTSRLQVILLLIWFGFAGVISFHTAGYYVQSKTIEDQTNLITSSKQSYRNILDQVSDYQLSIDEVTRELRETESHLRRLFGQNEALKQNLMSTEVALKLSEAERHKIVSGATALNDQLELLGSELQRIGNKNVSLEGHIGKLRDNLDLIQEEKEEIAAKRAQLDGRLSQYRDNLNEQSERNARLERHLHTLKKDLRAAINNKNKTIAENKALQNEVDELQQTVIDNDENHRAQLETIVQRAKVNITTIEDVIRRTGLNLNDLAPIPEGMLRGQGGPFIPYHPDMEIDEEEVVLEESLERSIRQWEHLRDIFVSVPIISPLENYYITSRYGRRRDPFNGRLAMHRGLDMGGPYKQPVLAPAPGRVIFSGRRSKYGRVVDLDHGNGIKTRYAHLYRTKVKRGQVVRIGDVIGLLGSSGRSSAPHLHYEVRYKDKTRNPRLFLKAGKYVQQKSQTQ